MTKTKKAPAKAKAATKAAPKAAVEEKVVAKGGSHIVVHPILRDGVELTPGLTLNLKEDEAAEFGAAVVVNDADGKAAAQAAADLRAEHALGIGPSI